MNQQSIHAMQHYVVGAVGLMAAAGVSFPIAMARVSHTEKFLGQAVKSADCSGQSLQPRQVIDWRKDCASLKVMPK
jgi:hypothetical protein